MKSPVVKRSIVIANHKTSVSLEDPFWDGLKEIAGDRDSTLSGLVDTINTERRNGNLSSAIRLFVLDHYRAQAGVSRAQASRHDLPMRAATPAPDLNGAGRRA
jgi:predicted DNA-binding ribbon-helix-helix protein